MDVVAGSPMSYAPADTIMAGSVDRLAFWGKLSTVRVMAGAPSGEEAVLALFEPELVCRRVLRSGGRQAAGGPTR